VIKSIRPVWDETIVLPESKIGKLSILARRSGDLWMLAVMIAGPAPDDPGAAVLPGRGPYKASLVRDHKENSGAGGAGQPDPGTRRYAHH